MPFKIYFVQQFSNCYLLFIRKLQEKLSERWLSLRGRTHQDCVRVYLAVARKWQFCGAKLFLTRVRDCTSPDDVWLAVQEDGVAVLEHSTMVTVCNCLL